ncbi:Glycosyl hydrolase, BNR repeat precursor, partial [hydrothermal vent metagenome]
MKILKHIMLISVFAIATFSMLITTNWIENKQTKSEHLKITDQNFMKYQKTNGEAIAKENWSQKKQKVKGVLEADAPDKFAEIQVKMRTARDENKPSYKRNYRFEEFMKAKKQASLMKSAGNSVSSLDVLNWIERGPANVGGRTRSIVVDPDDATFGTWYAASVGGGVWRTTDAGQSWVPLTDDLPNLAVSCLEMAASNHDVLYAGTGEGFFNADAIQGNGIMKTTDRGATWSQLASTADDPNFAYVNRLAIDPLNENIVIAATNTGIYKTTDGGTTWTEKFTGRIQDLRANPQNFNTLFAPANNGVIRSWDAGETWVLPEKAKLGGGRAEIAIATTDTNRIYASVNSSPQKVFATLDGGTTWMEAEEFDGADINWLGGQGWYDNTIGVNPFDEDIVYMGGIDLWKSEISTDSIFGITNITDTDLDTLFTYNPLSLPERSGGIGTGKDFWGEPVLVNTELTDIEIRFGPGKSQKAHMFTAGTYIYKDYIDVPFEVWDTKNNKQLMCSFTDVYRNDMFYLGAARGDVIFINNVDYDSTSSSSDIAKENGLKYENSYVVGFRMIPGKRWDPENLPDILLRIEVGKLPSLTRKTVAITDAYGSYPTDTYVHPDHHNITLVVTNESAQEFLFLNGNDGGVAVSYDGGASFDEVGNNGYNTSQFYGADKKPLESRYFGGMQDNGTWESPKSIDADKNSKYDFRIGGDGFEVSWHYGDGDKMMGGSQYNRFYKTTDGWNTYAAANVGFNGWGNSAISPFISKIAKSYSDPDLLFTITTEGVYRSENFGDSWSLYSIPEFANAGYFSFAQVTTSIASPQVVWAGALSDGLYVSKDGGISFQPTNDYTVRVMGGLSGLDTHPTDEATAYATYSFSERPKILRTTDYGQTWEDITGYGSGSVSTNGFPNVATYCVSVMPYNTDIIWAGTDIGLIESIDGGTSWHLANNGLPQVAIWEIRVVDDEVIVATHGRGIWSVSLPELADHKPPVVTLSPGILSANQGVSGIILYASLRSVYDSTHVVMNDKNVMTIKTSNVVDTLLIIPVNSYEPTSIYINSFKNGRTYRSTTADVDVVELLAPEPGYSTDFESGDDDFVLNGFNIDVNSGFSGASINSPHPYENNSDLTALLRIPVVIASTDATLEYDDIAVVEIGDPGTIFGDSNFWDYVIVEANNGTEWIYLDDGYDARWNSDWLNAYNGGLPGTESMYKSHSINLLDKFSPGDTVLFRFRLFADQFVSSWGWSIDNLVIQGTHVG